MATFAESLRSRELILSSPIAFLLFSEPRHFLSKYSFMSENLKTVESIVSQEEKNGCEVVIKLLHS